MAGHRTLMHPNHAVGSLSKSQGHCLQVESRVMRKHYVEDVIVKTRKWHGKEGEFGIDACHWLQRRP